MSKLLKIVIKLSFIRFSTALSRFKYPRPLGGEYASFGARLVPLSPPSGDGSIFRDYPKEWASFITVWFEVRVLPGPPRILANAEISWQPPNGPQLAGIAAGGSVSAETNSVHEGISGELSLALGIPFPGNGDRRQQRRVRMSYFAIKPSI
jgi:hypothetical protein